MKYAGDDPEIRQGLVAAPLAREFPGLRLAWTQVAAAPGPTPPDLRARLRAAADRIRGSSALALRTHEVPHLHRVFFRHVGLDPDAVPPPAEAIALRRMRRGGLPPEGLVPDALTIAALETGVGVQALDAARLLGALELRAEDTLVIADEDGPVAVPFAAAGERAAVSRSTRRIALVAVGVPAVADLVVEEALWTAWDILR